MSLKIGRQGLLGLGIESTPGTPVSQTTVVPFITNTLGGKHTAQADIAARGSRAADFTSVVGKQWGEGEVDVNVDLTNIGFFLKLAFGNEIVSNPATGVYDHLFYTTISGNTPTTATLFNYQGLDTQKFASMAIDKMDLDIKDAFMTAKVGFKGFFPTSDNFTQTTVSGTLVNFDNYTIKLGSTLVAALAAAAKPITEFMLTINNNAEVIFESGKNTASRVAWKNLKITGSFTQFFETVKERDDYYNLNKSSLILTASGNNIAGYQEAMTINLAKLLYTDAAISTGLENFYAVKTTFTAEVDPVQAKQIDAVLRNQRVSAYS